MNESLLSEIGIQGNNTLEWRKQAQEAGHNYLLVGEEIQAYLNLNKAGEKGSTFSIKAKRNNKWVVIAYVDSLTMVNVEFRIRKGTLSRIREVTGQKEVYAFLQGQLLGVDTIKPESLITSVYVNPFKTDYFVQEAEFSKGQTIRIDKAGIAHLQNRRVYI